MDDVRGLFLGMPHGTTPAAVTTNKNIIMSSFKSNRDIQKKEGGPGVKILRTKKLAFKACWNHNYAGFHQIDDGTYSYNVLYISKKLVQYRMPFRTLT